MADHCSAPVLSDSPRLAVGRHTRLVLALTLGIGVMAGCVRGSDRLIVRSDPHENPTSHEFPYAGRDLHNKAVAALAGERQIERPVFQQSLDRRDPRVAALTLSVSTADTPVFGADVLLLPGNSLDLYLHTFHEPLWQSPVYRSPAGHGLPFLAEFHVHLEPIGEGRTRMTVTARRTEVINGKKLSLGHNGPGWFRRLVPVPATTIEEFMVLRYIADFVGVALPEPILPRGTSL